MKSHTLLAQILLSTFLSISILVLGVIFYGSFVMYSESKVSVDSLSLGQGNPQNLVVALERWKKQQERNGGLANLNVGLGYSRAYSIENTSARGALSLNLLTGQVNVNLEPLTTNKNYSVWLIGLKNNQDFQMKIGDLHTNNAHLTLKEHLNAPDLADFRLTRVAVVELDKMPQNGSVVVGFVSLFQKMYFNNQLWTMAKLGEKETELPKETLPFAFLLPKVAMAANLTGADLFAAQIAKGNQLFQDETFGGNGRTCATCHRADNNHTLDPLYISKLPANDPLFVYETKPELKDLENGKLLRQYGLILANADGFDKPPVFRSPPHLLGLVNSIYPEAVDVIAQQMAAEIDESLPHEHPGETVYDINSTREMVGWSGDGAPLDGKLRSFAQGAIAQHFPKSLNRKVGLDFREATSDELDAMEAYMLSLGSPKDFNLDKMHFISPLTDRGKELFNSKFGEGTGRCLGCHNGAGSTSSTTTKNGLRDTGIENMELNPARLTDGKIAYDGGFGKNIRETCGINKDQQCYGDGRFNMTSLVEAADTAPYFHNNAVATLEEAIASYNSDAFNNSPGATSEGRERKIKIDSTKVTAIAAFLRTLNVIENVRNSNALDTRALREKNVTANITVKLALADTEDAIQVLEQSGYNPSPEALSALREAFALETSALKTTSKKTLLTKAIAKKESVKALLVECDKNNCYKD